MSTNDELDSQDKRNFWRSLVDPLHIEQHEHYTQNKKDFAEEDKRITKDITDAMEKLNNKLGNIK